jgi:ABC-type multidrug transport system fused ATPase/permease subunit
MKLSVYFYWQSKYWEYTLSSLRKQIAVVLQDVFLLHWHLIFNNITLNNDEISREQVGCSQKK